MPRKQGLEGGENSLARLEMVGGSEGKETSHRKHRLAVTAAAARKLSSLSRCHAGRRQIRQQKAAFATLHSQSGLANKYRAMTQANPLPGSAGLPCAAPRRHDFIPCSGLRHTVSPFGGVFADDRTQARRDTTRGSAMQTISLPYFRPTPLQGYGRLR